MQKFKWLGMLFVTAGLAVVGVADILFDQNPLDDTNAIITGDLLIIMAQIIVACQMVYEQKWVREWEGQRRRKDCRYVQQYDVPALFAVGLEGLFGKWESTRWILRFLHSGMTILGVLLFPMYYIRVPSTFSTDPEVITALHYNYLYYCIIYGYYLMILILNRDDWRMCSLLSRRFKTIPPSQLLFQELLSG